MEPSYSNSYKSNKITLNKIWAFSRPHTIIGSVISIFTIFFIISSEKNLYHLPYLLLTIIIGITCNIFIVGINQIADIEIDKINKPYLPLPSGQLNIESAKKIITTAAIIAISISFAINFYLFLTILLSIFIGWAYSMPPIYLKKHHISSAFAISFVRGILLNLCGYLIFNWLINNSMFVNIDIVILSVFIFLFSIVISWFKDLNDVEGDKEFNLKTLPVLYSTRTAIKLGLVLICFAYIFCIVSYSNILLKYENNLRGNYLMFGHLILMIMFIYLIYKIDLKNKVSIQSFYKNFWLFFFAEYILYLTSYILF